jgi:YfiH family protein
MGACASFNLASNVGDAPAAVAANRARLAAALGLTSAPRWLRQVHGVGVSVQRPEPADGAREPPEADAAVAFEPGVVLAVLSADCLPVVLAHRSGGRIGIAHAGWRGLAAGVIERTVAALAAPAAELTAWLGPAIGPAAFEVGAEVRAAFVAADAGAASAFVANARGRWQADLYQLAGRRLQQLGVAPVAGGGACTYTETERFFSFRRDRVCGRMATLVWVERPA